MRVTSNNLFKFAIAFWMSLFFHPMATVYADPSRSTVVENVFSSQTTVKAKNNLQGEKGQFREDELIVRFKKGIDKEQQHAVHIKKGGTSVRTYRKFNDLSHVKIPKGKRLQDMLSDYRSDPDVMYAEPNYKYQTQTLPNDPSLGGLWGLNNTGQTGGVIDADINAVEAWSITTGSPDVVIAIIDTGVDYTHPDLASNVWSNPGEIAANGIDDDGDGYVDDVHGINTITGSGDPFDDNGHGTHVAGTIAAAGNNELGVVGVNWSSKIISCKFKRCW